MNDFAAAAMMQLIRLAAARRQWSIDEAPARGARVPLARKRALLDRLAADHGPIGLLDVGQAIDDAPDEPVATALKVAFDPLDLVERWQRLERFVHSRHRTVVHRTSERGLLLRHVALAPHGPPTVSENLIVFGLFAALFDRIAGSDVRVRFRGQKRWRSRSGAWSGSGFGRADVLEVRWCDGVRPATAIRPDLGGDAVALARRFLADDPGRAWRLPLLASRVAVAPRSLQRMLGRRGTSFSRLLTDVRLAQAAKLLVQSRQPLAAIGYACGFSDQAHFTREMRRHVALTPLEFRRQFVAGAGGSPGPRNGRVTTTAPGS